jgi:hypothetical protein
MCVIYDGDVITMMVILMFGMCWDSVPRQGSRFPSPAPGGPAVAAARNVSPVPLGDFTSPPRSVSGTSQGSTRSTGTGQWNCPKCVSYMITCIFVPPK